MKSTAEIRAESPFPWHYATLPMGRVVVVDSQGREVPLFAVLDMACRATIEQEAKVTPL